MNVRFLSRTAVQFAALLTIAAMLASMVPVSVNIASADHDTGAPYEGEVLGKQIDGGTIQKISICHSTGSVDNPFTNPDVSVSSFFSSGHDSDNSDIIPPFHYTLGDGVLSFAGMNWDTDGQALWSNGCVAVADPIPGCTDADATNYDPDATADDGSCTYPEYEWELTMEKKFSGEDFGFEEADFSFEIVGDHGVDEIVSHDGTIMLKAGSYTVTEIPPQGFDLDFYEVQWSGKLCENVTGPNTTITLTEDLEKFNPDRCVADNIYMPGYVEVEKVIVGTTTDYDNFSFTVNGGDAIEFAGNGVNVVEVPAGDYDIVEVPAAGFTTEYDNCSGTIENDEDVTCVITNTWTGQDVPGCTDPAATNYDPQANVDDGSCQFDTPVLGCTDAGATNYNPDATEDDGSCQFDTTVLGCTDPAATNYNPAATVDDGSCDLPVSVCTDASPAWAASVEAADQGNKKDGNPVIPARSNTADVLGAANWTVGGETGFYSLGFGGSITVAFENYVPDQDGDDLSIHEATNGDDYPLEKAKVEVSQDNSTWFELTEEARNDTNEDGDGVTLLDFTETGLPWITYVRITDTTDPEPHVRAGDGFDLDAVDAVESVCDEPADDGGDDEEPVTTYLLEGYVWEDVNQNDVWDGQDDDGEGQEGDEQPSDPELPLSGWTVRATQGDTVFSTTTDQNGYYYFELPAGTWTISEVVKEEWSQTFPNDGTYVVEITDPEAEVVAATDTSFLTKVKQFLVPVAHAQVVPATTFGPFNFGNVFVGSAGGTSSGGGGGGGATLPRCNLFEADRNGNEVTLTWETSRGDRVTIDADGTEIFLTTDASEVDDGSYVYTTADATDFVLTVNRGNYGNTCDASVGEGTGASGTVAGISDDATPTPQVLGEQVSAVPYGGAAAGGGGTATPVTILPVWFGLRLRTYRDVN